MCPACTRLQELRDSQGWAWSFIHSWKICRLCLLYQSFFDRLRPDSRCKSLIICAMLLAWIIIMIRIWYTWERVCSQKATPSRENSDICVWICHGVSSPVLLGLLADIKDITPTCQYASCSFCLTTWLHSRGSFLLDCRGHSESQWEHRQHLHSRRGTALQMDWSQQNSDRENMAPRSVLGRRTMDNSCLRVCWWSKLVFGRHTWFITADRAQPACAWILLGFQDYFKLRFLYSVLYLWPDSTFALAWEYRVLCCTLYARHRATCYNQDLFAVKSSELWSHLSSPPKHKNRCWERESLSHCFYNQERSSHSQPNVGGKHISHVEPCRMLAFHQHWTYVVLKVT